MDLGENVDFYDDITVPIGCDLIWSFSLAPWDATATTAAFIATTPDGVDHSLSMTIAVSQEIDTESTFTIHQTAAQLAALGATAGTLWSYRVRWTDTAGVVWPLGYGKLVNR